MLVRSGQVSISKIRRAAGVEQRMLNKCVLCTCCAVPSRAGLRGREVGRYLEKGTEWCGAVRCGADNTSIGIGIGIGSKRVRYRLIEIE